MSALGGVMMQTLMTLKGTVAPRLQTYTSTPHMVLAIYRSRRLLYNHFADAGARCRRARATRSRRRVHLPRYITLYVPRHTNPVLNPLYLPPYCTHPIKRVTTC
jgi:hypothetical protein